MNDTQTTELAVAHENPLRWHQILIPLFPGLVAVALWLAANISTDFDPMLWYLNWWTGSFGLTQHFSSGIGIIFAIAALVIGCAVGVAKGTPITSATGAIVFLIFAVLGDGGVSRQMALQNGMAKIECFQPKASACLLNDFARMYDLGWQRPLSAKEKEQFEQYSIYREQARMGKPKAVMTPLMANEHQRELRKWELRFKPELDALVSNQS